MLSTNAKCNTNISGIIFPQNKQSLNKKFLIIQKFFSLHIA